MARGSNVPGVTAAKVLEELMAGYNAAFEHEFQKEETQAQPVARASLPGRQGC
jgi:hypothetical protein